MGVLPGIKKSSIRELGSFLHFVFKILQGFSWGFRIHGLGLRVQD